MIFKTNSAEETLEVGKRLAANLTKGGVVCLFGDLGSGKTTLAQGIAMGLGVKGRISSPTFVVVRQYPFFVEQEIRSFWHIDLYRLEDKEQMEAIGMRDILADAKSVILIEWPEKAMSLLPKHFIEVRLKVISENEREIDEIIH